MVGEDGESVWRHRILLIEKENRYFPRADNILNPRNRTELTSAALRIQTHSVSLFFGALSTKYPPFVPGLICPFGRQARWCADSASPRQVTVWSIHLYFSTDSPPATRLRLCRSSSGSTFRCCRDPGDRAMHDGRSPLVREEHQLSSAQHLPEECLALIARLELFTQLRHHSPVVRGP